MNLPKDYYSTLQLPTTASESQIKKSFRKLSLKWHPDKNPTSKELATEKFKEISQAYETLSDQDKKADYDRYGYARVNPSFTSAEDIFNMFFAKFGFESREDSEYFEERRYESNVFGRKKPKYYSSNTPVFVGRDYKDIFKGYYSSCGSGINTTSGTMFGGMTSVGGRSPSLDIPSSNIWSSSNSTLGGFSPPQNNYYHNYSQSISNSKYSKYTTPYTSSGTYPSTGSVTNYGNSTVSKEVEKVTSYEDGKKVVTTKTKVFNKDGTQTVTEAVEREGEERKQTMYKV